MRRNYLDVLKAYAIMAVVFYHLGILKYGYLGVDLFLVIAGYLTTLSVRSKIINQGELIKVGANSPSGNMFIKKILKLYYSFEIKRIERLLPPLVVAGIICMVVGFFVMIDDTYESLSQSVIATNFFVNNIVELIATGDYWANDKMFSPLMHTWYVGLVMQFYLLYPILFYVACLNKGATEKTIFFILVMLTVVSLMFFIGEENTARRFYLLPARFFEFSVGGIVALKYKPLEGKVFSRVFVYICYALLLLSFVINEELIPSNTRLLLVVSLTAVLISSQDILEKKDKGTYYLAKVGAASYSIFIWHQVVLAFFRSLYGSHFSIGWYFILLLIVSVLSWISYEIIEIKTGELLKSKNRGKAVCVTYVALFVLLNAFSIIVYTHAGVVRDIPELEVAVNNPQRAMWANYNTKVYKWEKPFETDNVHWLVIGNSFGRDFANVIMESEISDKIELQYCDLPNYRELEFEDQLRQADKVFIASKNYTEELVHNIELLMLALGHSIDDVIVVGDKYFGETMTQAYAKRFTTDYYKTSIELYAEIIEKNNHSKQLYGDRFIDLLAMSCLNDRYVRLFTEEGMFISSDCIHLTRSGAIFFARQIKWSKYLDATVSNSI